MFFFLYYAFCLKFIYRFKYERVYCIPIQYMTLIIYHATIYSRKSKNYDLNEYYLCEWICFFFLNKLPIKIIKLIELIW